MQDTIRNSAARAINRATLLVVATALLAPAGGGCARTAQAQYLEGLGEESRGDLREAADCYEDALDHEPNHLEAVRRLARLKVRAGAYQDAVPLYERAVRLTNGSPEAHNDLAYCYEVAGAYPAAEAAYQKGVEAHPAYARLRVNYGLMLARQGRNDEALAHLRAVMPEADAQYNLGRAVAERARRGGDDGQAFRRTRELARNG